MPILILKINTYIKIFPPKKPKTKKQTKHQAQMTSMVNSDKQLRKKQIPILHVLFEKIE